MKPEAPAHIDDLRLPDQEAARAIYNHYVVHSTATFDTEPLGPDAFARLVTFDDPRHGAFGVRDQAGVLLGYCLLAPYKSRCAYADASEVAVYLAPDAIGRGLGRRAVEHLVEQGRARGLHVLIAGACTENEASVAVFGACGFVPCAQFREVGFKFGRRLDVTYLQRILA